MSKIIYISTLNMLSTSSCHRNYRTKSTM